MTDITDDDRPFTVDQLLNVQDTEPQVPELTVEEQIDNARLETLTRYQRVSDLLDEAIERRDAAQDDINRLREAMALWEPIHNRLVNGPPRRARSDEQEELTPIDTGV